MRGMQNKPLGLVAGKQMFLQNLSYALIDSGVCSREVAFYIPYIGDASPGDRLIRTKRVQEAFYQAAAHYYNEAKAKCTT